MIHHPKIEGYDGAGLERLWRQVCTSRGTPAPDPARLAGFIDGLGTHEGSVAISVNDNPAHA
jgi:hypothetical protein